MLLNDESELQKRATIYHQNIKLDSENDSKALCYHYIEEGKTVLDVGCACGDLGGVLQGLKNCTVFGVEYNPGSIKIAEQTKAYKKIWQADLNHFDPDVFSELKGKLDYIVFADVLEHLADPKVVLSKFKGLLAEKGKIVISLPNVAHASVQGELLLNNFEYTASGVLDKTHVSFYTSRTISAFCTETGLKINDIQTTLHDPKGMSEANPFFKLPFCVSKFILSDYHSWIWQYVLLLDVNDGEEDLLAKQNNKKFVEFDDLYQYKKMSQNYLKKLFKRKFIRSNILKLKLFLFKNVFKSEQKCKIVKEKLEYIKCQ